jgi:cell division protease FtsH
MANQQNNNNNQNNNNPNNNDDKGFFNNPILVFVVFSIVSIMAFKTLFPQDDMNANAANGTYGQQQKTVSYSDLKTLINNGSIDYVGIGPTTIKATGKLTTGEQVAYKVRRVVPDETLVPTLEEKKIAYGAFSEENLLGDMLFGWVLPILIFFLIWSFLAKRMAKSMGGGILGMGGSKKMINSEKPNVKF